jgi:hypothetical protein
MDDVKPLPNLTADEAVAWFEGQGFRCQRSTDFLPVTFACATTLAAGVEAMGVNITTDGAHVALGLNAYVVAPKRSDFNDYASSFFRDMVLAPVLAESDRPDFAAVRQAARSSGTILVDDYRLGFGDSDTSRTMHVEYVGP